MNEKTLLCLIVLLSATVRTHADEKTLADPPNTEPASARALPAEQAAAGFRLPLGFQVKVFAAEPDVQNPVAMAWDPRGRLWVAENYTYAELPTNFDLRLRDRVLIFEDADGDGRFDKRTVFTDQVQMLTSVEIGLGGVWLMCPPRLMFIPDRNGDDVPDGPAEVRLDGFMTAGENHHTLANGLRWGPDGWLYGRCGASSPGLIGTPGTPDALRVPIRGGLWRYHPQRKRVEVLAHGTTNPWGHDWNALGEAFFINTVNGHLWHLIPGAHFVRPHTIEPNPRVYAPIDQHADHFHWDTSKALISGETTNPEDKRRGGGHAHSGLSIYLADQWPESYRGKLLTLNFHGRRMNVERLEREGSGYVGRHEPDIAFAADPWFRGIDLAYGPDGGLFVLDWSDTGECHEHNGVHRTSGRIFKITYGKPAPVTKVDPGAPGLDERALVALHGHANEWFVRQARRVLADRSARGERLEEARTTLRSRLLQESDPVLRLRAFWTLNLIGGVDDGLLRSLVHDPHESFRAWAIRLLTDNLPLDTIYSQPLNIETRLPGDLMTTFTRLGRDDPSGLVRLVLASTLQRLPVNQRLDLARALVMRSEDAADHNLPSLIWTSLIPVAAADPVGVAKLAADCRMPLVVRAISRRLGEEIDGQPAPANLLLEIATQKPEAFQAHVLEGLTDALAGRHKARQPEAWPAFRARIARSDKAQSLNQARNLDVLFGDGRALDDVKRIALDSTADLETRMAALSTLIENRPTDLRSLCEKLLRVRFLNTIALRGLALFDDPSIGRTLAQSYRTFHAHDRPAVLEALVSRPSFAHALLDQVAAGKIPRADITPLHARQIRGLGSQTLSEQLSAVWGDVRTTPADRRQRMSALKSQLNPTTLARADRGRGRAVFERVCASCHRLYGQGGDIGPDLTGGGRTDVDYLLENIVDPSAVVSADYRMTSAAMSDGRVLSGILRSQSEQTLTLQTPTEKLMLNRADVEKIQPSQLSLMPDGLLDPLNPTEVRDLFAYLMSSAQVPISNNAQ